MLPLGWAVGCYRIKAAQLLLKYLPEQQVLHRVGLLRIRLTVMLTCGYNRMITASVTKEGVEAVRIH